MKPRHRLQDPKPINSNQGDLAENRRAARRKAKAASDGMPFTSMRNLSRILLSLLTPFLLALHLAPVAAQDFPSKPIHLVVPSGPGNPQDVVARTLADEMGKLIGQPVVIDNKPGAAQLLGYEYVARQVPADGYTLVVGNLETMASLPVTVKNIKIDMQKDLVPVMDIAAGRYVLAVSSRAQWKTLDEMVAEARSNPGKLNYGYMSLSTSFLLEVVLRDKALKVVDVPFGGNLPAFSQALTEGTAHMAVLSEPTFNALGDKVRAVAVTGDERNPAMPGVPTFTELGSPQITGFSFSLNAPAGTPKPVIDKIHAAAVRALQQPGLRATFAKMGLTIARDTSQEAARKTLAGSARMFADVAAKTGFQPQ